MRYAKSVSNPIMMTSSSRIRCHGTIRNIGVLETVYVLRQPHQFIVYRHVSAAFCTNFGPIALKASDACALKPVYCFKRDAIHNIIT